MIKEILKFLIIILLCISLIAFVIKGEGYNETFTLSYFMGQITDEDIPNIYEPVRKWFEEIETGNEVIDTIAGVIKAITYGAVVPMQVVIFIGHFFKVWLT